MTDVTYDVNVSNVRCLPAINSGSSNKLAEYWYWNEYWCEWILMSMCLNISITKHAVVTHHVQFSVNINLIVAWLFFIAAARSTTHAPSIWITFQRIIPKTNQLITLDTDLEEKKLVQLLILAKLDYYFANSQQFQFRYSAFLLTIAFSVHFYTCTGLGFCKLIELAEKKIREKNYWI